MGAEEIVVRWGNMAKFTEDLETVGGQAADIETYAREQVFNKSGFEYKLCVLQPLSDMMDTLGDVFGDIRSTFDSRWTDLTAALATAASDTRTTDDAAAMVYHHASRPGMEF